MFYLIYWIFVLDKSLRRRISPISMQDFEELIRSCYPVDDFIKDSDLIKYYYAVENQGLQSENETEPDLKESNQLLQKALKSLKKNSVLDDGTEDTFQMDIKTIKLFQETFWQQMMTVIEYKLILDENDQNVLESLDTILNQI